MKKWLLYIVSVFTLSTSWAGGMGSPTPWNWTGFYVGIHEGWVWGSYNPHTAASTVDPLGVSTAQTITGVGDQVLNPNGFSTGIAGGYNWQCNHYLLGFEADFETLDLSGFVKTGAVPYPSPDDAFTFVVSAYANNNWMATFRPRVGLVANDWLFYATGGLGLTRLNDNFLFSDDTDFGALESGRIHRVKASYTVGAGIEKKIKPNLSIKAEYLYSNFGRNEANITSSELDPASPVLSFTHSAGFIANMVRVGINYQFGDLAAGPLMEPCNWIIEAGARFWFNNGSLGAPQPLLNNFNDPVLASRLVYKPENGYAGETFVRLDDSSDFFVKGLLGAGGITSGKMLDEDFPVDVYSNTSLDNNSGHQAYATADFGYSLIRTIAAKFGPFVGYNYFTQHINTYGCHQLAGDGTCTPEGTVPNDFLIIANDNRLDSLRLGLSSQFFISDQLRFTTETAYLPWVSFNGVDHHNGRGLVLPFNSNQGNGLMLEAALDYKLTNSWFVGVGGRFWAWNMRNGSEIFNFLDSSSASAEPIRLNNERYGVFVQSSYQWGGVLVHDKEEDAASKCWTGFYVGGQLGGGWSDDSWYDPFPSTVDDFSGLTNVRGFGDSTHATGPLGGGLIGGNWQYNAWVLGVEADWNAANITGENTCFSGIGGVNCRRIVNSLATLTARVGLTYNQSLVYAKGGGSWSNADYQIQGNTNALRLGNQDIQRDSRGWTTGVGIEYALTPCWSTFFEYNYLDLGDTKTYFANVSEINAFNIPVSQSMNLFKTGVNYKFL